MMRLGVGRRWVLPVTLGVTLLTIVSQAVPALHLDASSRSAHVAIETAFGLGSLLAAALLGARCARSPSPADLLAIAGLGVTGLTSLAGYVGPASAGLVPSAADAWLPMPGRLLGAALLAAAAFAPSTPRARLPRARVLVAGTVGATLLATAAGAALGGIVPLSHAAAEHPLRLRDAASVLLVAVQLAGFAAMGLAALGFLRRAATATTAGGPERRAADPFLLALAGGCWCTALSRVGMMHAPSLYSDVVRNGDLLRLAGAAAILAATGVELRAHQRRLVELAAAGERRRMARELHDGLSQELAFIVGRSRVLSRRPADAESLARLASAADRALDASRAAIHELRATPAESLAERLAGHAREIAHRGGVAFEAGRLEPLEVPAEHERAAIALVREAATNVVRHAEASRMRFEVARAGDELRVVLADDGRGLDATAPPDAGATGFGRISMADRAQELGGRLEWLSAPGAGTRVELRLGEPSAPAPDAPAPPRRPVVRPARSLASS